MIIYLSGPMTDIEQLNHPEFNRVAKLLYEKGYEVVNPAEIEQPDTSHATCMREDFKEMLNRGVDTLALLKGWENSKGARGEIFMANLLGMQIVDAYTLEPIEVDVQLSIRVIESQPRGEGQR